MNHCFFSRCDGEVIHGFAKEENTTALCGAGPFEKFDTGDDETEMCLRCVAESLALLGLSPAQISKAMADLEPGHDQVFE